MTTSKTPMRVVGRYALYGEIAAGGMATVHFGRLLGPVGFARTVAIKRLHPQFAKDPEFVAMFLDEARLAARIRHPNVIPTLDVVATDGELFLVMEYVQGESLSHLLRAVRAQGRHVPPRIASAVLCGALHGLHAAHEASDESGAPLGIVHRDVSPQNVLVGIDGVPRVLDFGVAKAAGRVQTTREGQLKGKLAYMAPEQLSGQVSRQTDVFAAAVVLWEALTSQRLFAADNEAAVLGKLLSGDVEPPSRKMDAAAVAAIPADALACLDAVTLRGLHMDPSARFPTAREMALALERCHGLASPSEVGAWVEAFANDVLSARADRIAGIESSSTDGGAAAIDLDGTRASDPPRARASGAPDEPSPAATDGHSQLSSVSLSRSRSPDGRRAGRGAPFFVAAASVAVAVAAVVTMVVVLTTSRASRDAAPPATSMNAAATASIAPPGPAAGADAAPRSADLEGDAPSSSAADRAAAAAPSAAPPARPAPARAAHPPRRAKPAVQCDPPFTLDAAGRKHYKAECL